MAKTRKFKSPVTYSEWVKGISKGIAEIAKDGGIKKAEDIIKQTESKKKKRKTL